MKKRTFGIKTLIATVCICVLLCGTVGGTIAWLIAKTDTVTNTFTYGDINIKLEETDSNKDGDNDVNTNTYPMKPGNKITKDPIVYVEANSEDNWLFVKVEKEGGDVKVLEGTVEKTYIFDDFLEYKMAEGWVELDAVKYPGVYYREVAMSDARQQYDVIDNHTVTVKDTVTKEMLNALDKDANGNAITSTKYPVIKITAYAVQKDNVVNTALSAWEKVEPPVVTP